jgi:hypothetical protein
MNAGFYAGRGETVGASCESMVLLPYVELNTGNSGGMRGSRTNSHYTLPPRVTGLYRYVVVVQSHTRSSGRRGAQYPRFLVNHGKIKEVEMSSLKKAMIMRLLSSFY